MRPAARRGGGGRVGRGRVAAGVPGAVGLRRAGVGRDQGDGLIHVEGPGLSFFRLGIGDAGHGIGVDAFFAAQKPEQAAQGGELASHGGLGRVGAVEFGQKSPDVIPGDGFGRVQGQAASGEVGLELGQILGIGGAGGRGIAFFHGQVGQEGLGRFGQARCGVIPVAGREHSNSWDFPWLSFSGSWPVARLRRSA